MKILKIFLAVLFCFACQSAGFANTSTDSDGDGVNDYREQKDGTDPKNASSFNSLSKGLVAFYPFNGNANDESGNGLNGSTASDTLGFETLQAPNGSATGSINTVAPTSDISGSPNSAFKFSGQQGTAWDPIASNWNGSWVSIPNSGKIVSDIKKWTISCLIKLEEPIDNYQGGKIVTAQGDDYSGVQGFYLAYHLNSGFFTGAAENAGGPEQVESGQTLQPNRYYYVVGTYDGAKAEIWVDGEKMASKSVNYNVTSQKDISIGRHIRGAISNTPGWGNAVLGVLDNLRIYNRALSDAEVTQLYNKEGGFDINLDMVEIASSEAVPLGYPDFLPEKSVFLPKYFIAKDETTFAQWDNVVKKAKTDLNWTLPAGVAGSGYTDVSMPTPLHPVTHVTFVDVALWCNAASIIDGLEPCYSTKDSNSQTIPLTPSSLSQAMANGIVWSKEANGYRLPTGDEWEVAARGGLKSQVYPWGNTSANAQNSNWVIFTGHPNNTTPVGTYPRNGFGLSDCAGNVLEITWDTTLAPADEVPTELKNYVVRGGGWQQGYQPKITFGHAGRPFSDSSDVVGFRLARNAKSNMVTVQGGTLPEGSGLAGQSVGAFQIGKFETTWGEWKAVRDWAVANGYTDLAGIGAGSGDDHPVRNVSWYDVVKWCNAKSEMEGLTPVYQFGGATHKTGQSVPNVISVANGYRLPLDKEWEWTARGGVSGVSHNYVYSGSNSVSEVAWTSENSPDGTKAVGTKAANELGIYDMSGNVWEWCWDVAYASDRRRRSGGWTNSAGYCTVAFRDNNYDPGDRNHALGFRLARNSGTPDTTAPVIGVTSISANARLTSANATFGGTITETGSKPTLQHRLGTTGNWTSSTVGGSSSPYSFSQLVALKPGPNTVQFQAKDDAGNTSALASINVSYVVASTLTITAPNAADGTVTSGFGGSTSREVGVSYTVTATPASGMVFKEWLKNGVSAGANATLTFTMQPGLTLKPVFLPDFAKLGGFYNGLVGVGAIGNGTAADMQAFAANNGFIQITSGTNGALSGVLKIEGKSHSFTGTMGSNKRATITVPRPGKGNATLSLSLISALPGEISGNVTTSGAPLAFRALRGGYTAGAAKHALAGKRYAIVLPPPSGLAMGYGHATLTVEDNGAAVLSGVLANGQAVNAGARIVDDGAGNWVFPVYVGGSGIFTGEIVIPKTTPASGSELGGSLEWLKPASNTGLFKSGFLKSLQPLGATHSTTSAGLGGAAFSLTLDPAKRMLSAAVVQTGTWGNSGSPNLTTPVKSGLALSFNPLSGKFEGSFTRTVNGAPLPTPIQGTLFSRPITIPGGATLRGAGFFTSGNASTAVEITSNGTVESSANMVAVQGGTLPGSYGLTEQEVQAFQIGRTEVTWDEWQTVRTWALANGYTDLAGVGQGSAGNHPVRNVSWYDVVKWANAKSQREGLTPVYSVNGTIYKIGLFVPTPNSTANGYRLPGEAEWEWAARGGIVSKGYSYSGGNNLAEVGWYRGNSEGAIIDLSSTLANSKAGTGTWPVAQKKPNELGLFDMSGNISEWCWDKGNPDNSQIGGYQRHLRGPSWYNDTIEASVIHRTPYGDPTARIAVTGLRLARNAGN